jgi:hypothetical protein
MSEEFAMSRAQVDGRYRNLADYVFSQLVYTQSRSCCWNSTTAAMYEIVMLHAEAQQADAAANNECAAPPIFMGRDNGVDGDGFQRYAEYADSIGRGGDWVPWSADEACSQSGNRNDTPEENEVTAFCDRPEVNEGPDQPNSCDTENDTRSTATALSGNTFSGTLCEGSTVDFYSFEVAGRESVTVEVTFSHADGDIDLVLEDAAGSQLERSQSSTDDERINATLSAGTYRIRVYGYNGATGDYQVGLSREAVEQETGGSCGDAGDSNATAVAVTGSREGLRICDDESDYWAYTATGTGSLTVQIAFTHSAGDLDLTAHRGGEQIGISQGTGNSETIELDLTSGETVVIRVYGYSGATGDYSLTIEEG